MAKGYRPVARDQQFLLPPDMREWLPGEHPVWLVIDVVAGHLDTAALHRGRRAGGAGAAGYDPGVLVAPLGWADADGGTRPRPLDPPSPTPVALPVISPGGAPPPRPVR